MHEYFRCSGAPAAVRVQRESAATLASRFANGCIAAGALQHPVLRARAQDVRVRGAVPAGGRQLLRVVLNQPVPQHMCAPALIENSRRVYDDNASSHSRGG
jgi:hypothetical protein